MAAPTGNSAAVKHAAVAKKMGCDARHSPFFMQIFNLGLGQRPLKNALESLAIYNHKTEKIAI